MTRRTSPLTRQADLPGHSLGVALGSDADSLARRLVSADKRIRLENSFDEPVQVLAALHAAQIDAALVDNVVALTAVQDNPDLHILQPALTLEPYVIAMPPQAFQLQSEVNRILKQLQTEGFMEALNRRWLR